MLLAQHSPKLQQVAWNFAKHLDITHKIWSDLCDFSREKSLLTNNKSENILNAIYNDKYKQIDESTLSCKTQNAAEVSVAAAASSSRSFSSSFSNVVSAYFSSNNSTNSQCDVSENTMNYVVDDCKVLFNDHYNLAVENLVSLENEYSKKEAIDSLKSMLDIMRSSIF